MIESDCKIPTDYQPIEQPETYPLHGTAAVIKGMIDAGHHAKYIRRTLCIREEEYRDALFEIRKADYDVKRKGKSGKLSGLHDEIYQAWQDGQSVTALATQYDVSKASISYIIKKQSKGAPTMQINQEFEDAVNEMIAQADEPITMTEEHTAAPPKAVLDAVCEHIRLEGGCIADKLAKIKRMQQEIEESRTQIAELKTWLEANGYESD